jgi:hypothetical protein
MSSFATFPSYYSSFGHTLRIDNEKKLADIPVPQDPESEQVRNHLVEMHGRYQDVRRLARSLDFSVSILLQYL